MTHLNELKNRDYYDFKKFTDRLDYKNWLKESGAEIRFLKNYLANAQRNHKYNETYSIYQKIIKLQSLYRSYHIAYSLLRGRTMEQIERNHKLQTSTLPISFAHDIYQYFEDQRNEK